jgi:Protein of unknown function (DUF3307)
MTPELILAVLLFTKHFIVDFPLQFPYNYLNKGTYGHAGGVLHAAAHGLATSACFAAVMGPGFLALGLGLLDAVLHYHIDWAKMNLNKRLGYGPTTSEKFWWLLGLDQYLHALTYIGLIWIST